MRLSPRHRLPAFAWTLLLLVSVVDLHALGGDDHGTALTGETFYLCQAEDRAPASHVEPAHAVSPEECPVCQHREHSRGLAITAEPRVAQLVLAAAAALPAFPPRPLHRRAGHGRAPPRS
ncbi:MAG: hypothetical protein AAF481_06750 [Acidobacteriota bacterium]